MSSVALFSLIAIALVAVALAFVLPTLLRKRTRREAASRAAINAEIYRQGVDELQQEVALGELSAADAGPAREELHRRLLEEAGEPPASAIAPRRSRRAALVVAVALPVVALALYLMVGKPDALTEESAVVQEVGEGADYIARLEVHLKRQPRDTRGWVLLARAHADGNDFVAAATAYEQAVAVPGSKVAKDPDVLAEYADVLGMTQGGRLAGKPTELIERALAIDPQHPAALEMAGSAAYADGRYAEAVRYWKELLAGLTPGSERHSELSAAVVRAERKASVSLPR
ncbi:MAG: c-type cytochrome biogenesis protein CcmI [Burkholderiaceae bacterium]